MNENKIAFWIIFGVLALVGIMWYAFENPALNPRLEEETYTIIRKWEMPVELNEISGVSWISENKIACIQDEDGIVYIYNLSSELIEKQINFSKSGDFEGVAALDSTLYVMESNGLLFEISNYLSDSFETKEYKTSFSGKNNLESLVADSINNQILFTVKDNDPNSESYKGIYAFNVESKSIEELPIVKIPLDNPIFKPKKVDDDIENISNFFPSDIAINPTNGNYYILEGKNPQLLIMDKMGKPLKIHKLHPESFPQPEGLTFSPDGTLYISNEGKGGTASVVEVEFDE